MALISCFNDNPKLYRDQLLLTSLFALQMIREIPQCKILNKKKLHEDVVLNERGPGLVLSGTCHVAWIDPKIIVNNPSI